MQACRQGAVRLERGRLPARYHSAPFGRCFPGVASGAPRDFARRSLARHPAPPPGPPRRHHWAHHGSTIGPTTAPPPGTSLRARFRHVNAGPTRAPSHPQARGAHSRRVLLRSPWSPGGAQWQPAEHPSAATPRSPWSRARSASGPWSRPGAQRQPAPHDLGASGNLSCRAPSRRPWSPSGAQRRPAPHHPSGPWSPSTPRTTSGRVELVRCAAAASTRAPRQLGPVEPVHVERHLGRRGARPVRSSR